MSIDLGAGEGGSRVTSLATQDGHVTRTNRIRPFKLETANRHRGCLVRFGNRSAGFFSVLLNPRGSSGDYDGH